MPVEVSRVRVAVSRVVVVDFLLIVLVSFLSNRLPVPPTRRPVLLSRCRVLVSRRPDAPIPLPVLLTPPCRRSCTAVLWVPGRPVSNAMSRLPRPRMVLWHLVS